MNFDKESISKLIANAYHQAALDPVNDMFVITELLEKIKTNLVAKQSEPYKAWNGLELDRFRFDKENILKVFVPLRQKYFEEHFENIKKSLQNKFDYKTWFNEYIDAIVYLSGSVFNPLCLHDFPFTTEQKKIVEKCRQMNDLIMDGRWADVFPLTKEFSQCPDLSAFQKSSMLVNIGYIQLFWYPDFEGSIKYFEEASKTDPDNGMVEKGWGAYYLKLQDYDKAIKHFEKAMQMDPIDVENYGQIGACHKERGDYAVAEQWYRNAIKYDFTNTDSYSKLIQLYGQWDAEAEKRNLIPELIYKCELLLPSDKYENMLYNIYRDAGYSYSVAGDYSTSEMYYQKAIDLKPEYTIAKIDFAYINGYQKKYDEAIRILKILETIPNYYDVHLGLAWVYEQVGQFDEALSEHQKCIAIRPEWADKSYNAIGKMYFDQKKDYLQAKKYYQKAIKIREKENIYYDNMIDALDRLDDEESLKEKEDVLIKQFSMNPKNDLVANKLGVLFYNTGKIEEAIPYYQKSIEINPDSNVYYENLGLAYEGIKNVEKAEEYYMEALRHKEESETCNRLGILYYKRNQNNDTDKAIEYYQKAIGLDPENAVLYENLGLAYEQKQMLKEAEEAYIKASEIEKVTGIYFNRLGYFYYTHLKHELAIKYYLKAIEREKDIQLYKTNLALAYEANKEPEKAVDIYLELLAENKADHNVRALLASAQYSMGEAYYKDALQNLLQCCEEDPGNILYKKYLGTLYEEMKEAGKAFDIYNELVKENPNDADSNNKLGVLYYRRGTKEDAQKAISYYNKAIELSPSESIYYQNLALAYEITGDNDKAVTAYEKSIEKASHDDQSYSIYAEFFFKNNQFEKAAELYNKAIEINPNSSLYYQNIGLTYERLNKNKEAEEAYLNLLKIESHNANFHNNLGVFYFQTQQVEKAIQKYKDALALDPDSILFYKNLAIAYQALDKKEEVEETYLTILKKDAGNDEIQNLLGVLYYKTNQVEKAIKNYLKAIELNPKLAVYYENLGLAYDDLGQYDQAEDAYLKSLKIDPNADRCLNLAGIFYHTKRNDYKTALELYSQAIKINAKEPNYFFNLGDVYTILNDSKQAATAYATAEELQKVI
ncbi:MAG TPA: tetratricopeptide repeat protein [Chitinophagaceae bacterium]|nr:tetratricopeptide repeat protein [Chitinophagaceae bacterium]